MLNKVILMGRLTADPELKQAGSASVLNFCIACDRDYVKEGEQREADFVNCVAWRHTADFISKWFRKGDMIALCGRVQVRKWQDDSGTNRYTTEIVADNAYFAGKKRESGEVTAPEEFKPIPEGEEDPDMPF